MKFNTLESPTHAEMRAIELRAHQMRSDAVAASARAVADFVKSGFQRVANVMAYRRHA